ARTSGPASARTGSGRSAICRPRRASASARLLPTMPEPRTCTSNCFIGLDCRQRCMTLCGEQGHNFAPEGVFEMPVWLRRGLWGLAALLLMLALVAGYLVSTFDANRYKSVAVDWMKV